MVQGTLEKSSQQRQQHQQRLACKYYSKGRCRYGSDCRFIHAAATAPGDRVTPFGSSGSSRQSSEDKSSNTATSTTSTSTRSDDGRSGMFFRVNKPCRVWQVGNCTWGDKCRFRHDAETGQSSTAAGGSKATVISNRVGDRAPPPDSNERKGVRPQAAAIAATTGSQTGNCRHRNRNELGSKEHAAIRQERQLQLAKEREEQREAKEKERADQRLKQEKDWAEEATATIQKVVLNSFVQFEAGLTIQRVICGFEASQILIKNLPLNAQKREIIALFTQQGVDPDDLAILRTDTVDGRLQVSVMGKAGDVEVIALGLDGIEFRDENLEFVVCERNSDGRTMGSSNRNSYHLNISYPKPFLSMIVRYPGIDTWEVNENRVRLDGDVLNGHRIRAEAIADGYDDDDDSFRYAIRLSRIPADTTVAEVQTFAKTRNVELYHDSLSYTLDGVFNTLESRLRDLPGSTLQRFTLDNSPRPKFVSVKAVFDTWESAKSAHDSLSGRSLGVKFPPLRLFLSDPYRFVMTLDENQYNAQKAQWSELCEGKSKEANIQTRTVDRAGGRKVIITLFGRDKKMVGALKVRIESMATGQKLDASYWHPSFKDPKNLKFFDDLYHSTGAYFRSDWKHNCLTVSGPTDAVDAGKASIKAEIERISEEQWTIPLQRRALGFFIREGLAKMKALLGEENITLDVKSAHIVLHGADLEEARHHLRQLMTAFSSRNASSSTTVSEENPCPVCYDTVSQPFEIGCQHIYCSSCLRHYILSTLDNHSFPLKCMGNDATCNQPLSLPLIQRFLPHQRFEKLMEAAFRSYVDKHPETFKYCNTPDCSQVYRATTFPQVLQCPSCFAEVCTACYNQGHGGMTCAERRVHRDAGEQERLLRQWAMESGVKRCPSCQAWVEKTAGCNHMSCKCGAHFCWICLGTFDSTQIYDHMSEAHGGIYTDPERRQPAAGQPQPDRVPDIVEVVGGPAAAAEQMAAFRRIEAERVNGVQPAPNNYFVRPLAAARIVANPAPPDAERQARLTRTPAWLTQLLREAGRGAEMPPLREREEETRRREAEERRRDERIRQAREQVRAQAEQIRNMREREAARRREAEARRREAENNKGWCTIM